MSELSDSRAAVRQFYNHRAFALHISGTAVFAYLALAGGLAYFGLSAGWLLIFVAALAYITKYALDQFLRRRFGRRAELTRQIQAKDALDAFLRVFSRTSLQLDELRTLNEVYQFDRERDLLQEVSLEDKLGQIYNKSIRVRFSIVVTTRGCSADNRPRRAACAHLRNLRLLPQPRLPRADLTESRFPIWATLAAVWVGVPGYAEPFGLLVTGGPTSGHLHRLILVRTARWSLARKCR